MTVTINGSGTMTGLAVGGLNDNIITKNEMATGGAWAPAGTVLQVVNFSTTSIASTTSTSYVDASGFVASITPTSATSKILVLFSCFTSNGTANTYSYVRVVRTGPVVVIKDLVQVSPSSFMLSGMSVAGQQLDSPNTTSAINYQVQIKTETGGGTSYIGRGANGGTECQATVLTLMEIAA